MKSSSIRTLFNIVLTLSLINFAQAQNRLRYTADLSGPGWQIWLDEEAQWENDKLHLPPVDLDSLPVHPPTGGWDALAKAESITVSVPTTIEEHFWDRNGDEVATNGNYQGVSWWRRTFTIPRNLTDKRFLLTFDSVVMRAEIFINEKMVGYDCIGDTPFTFDVTDAVKPGRDNSLAVRITDPFSDTSRSNFDWVDFLAQPWGDQWIPSIHGFGGITGNVKLIAVDDISITSLFIKNKPSPSESNPTDIDLDIELQNVSDQAVNGTINIKIRQKNYPRTVIYDKTFNSVTISEGLSVISRSLNCPDARLWSPDSPELYECDVTVHARGNADRHQETFGFRWFGPAGIGKDAQLRLNGKRIVLRSAISWGFFPVNGKIPTKELAAKQITAAKRLGQNMISSHRQIGHPRLYDAADEMGFLYHEEVGGFRALRGKVSDPFAAEISHRKLWRMVRRDRNHPSLVIYNMANEIWGPNEDIDRRLPAMAKAHEIDPTRIMTYSSGTAPHRTDNPKCKAWFAPYDEEMRFSGWEDWHWYATRDGTNGLTYLDSKYVNPNQYSGWIDPDADSGYNTIGPDDIIYHGEENAIGMPAQVGALVNYFDRYGRDGWDGYDYRVRLRGYQKWLDDNQAYDAFESVDAMCRAVGDVSYYNLGRTIENVRMDNTADGFVINGWECQKLENQSGMVDPARNHKGDPDLIACYNRPLYIAVKVRDHRIASPGETLIVDFYIINEVDVKGEHQLAITVQDYDGKELLHTRKNVRVTGGDVYGQMLASGIEFHTGRPGYTEISASLFKNGQLVTKGQDVVFVVDYKSAKLPAGGAVLEAKSPVKGIKPEGVRKFFADDLQYTAHTYTPDLPALPFIVAGYVDVDKFRHIDDVLHRVKNDGTTFIILSADTIPWKKEYFAKWGRLLAQKDVWNFRGTLRYFGTYNGGNDFAVRHHVLTDLPQACGLSWEYQSFVNESGYRIAAFIDEAEGIVGAIGKRQPDIGTSVGIVKHGKGHIIFTTHNALLKDLSSTQPQAAVSKKLLCNFIIHGNRLKNPPRGPDETNYIVRYPTGRDKPLEPGQVACSNCGAHVDASMPACNECGSDTFKEKPEPQ